MTTRRPFRRPATPFARRGVLLAAPALLLAGCGMLPGLPGASGDDESDDADAQATDGDGAEETAAVDSAVVELTAVEVADTAAAEELMTPLEGGQALQHPLAQVTVTATALLDSLEAAAYTALTGEEAPRADGGTEAASVVLPGDGKQFLLASWESTDPEWEFTSKTPSTELKIMVGGNQGLQIDNPRPDDAERSGTVLAIVDASPEAEAATMHAEVDEGVQELSLVDGSITETVAPALYERELAVEVSDAGSFETVVEHEFASGNMSVRGTIEEAFLTPYVSEEVELGGYLGWAKEDELHLVVPLAWDMDYSANVKDLSEVVLTLSDGTEVQPVQDRQTIFGTKHSGLTATFTIPAAEKSATITVTPRYEQVLDEEFEQVEDPISATLTFS